MHLYLLLRGIKHKQDELINDLQAQFFPFEQLDPKTNKRYHRWVQGALRPIQLF